MTRLTAPITREVDTPWIRGRLRRSLVVTIYPDGRLELRPKRSKALPARVSLHLLELYIRALINGSSRP